MNRKKGVIKSVVGKKGGGVLGASRAARAATLII